MIDVMGSRNRTIAANRRMATGISTTGQMPGLDSGVIPVSL